MDILPYGFMQRTLMLVLSGFVLASLSVHIAEARSGCCSHHGGVCGCGCCDGSSLSATCAPYYPECRSTAAATYKTASTCSVEGLYAAYQAHKSRGENMTGLSTKTWWIKCPQSVRQEVYGMLY
jgi:hypothetical protein